MFEMGEDGIYWYEMNVSELIDKLRRVPQDAKVIVEGCDCEGDCDGVVVAPAAWNKNEVLLAREDGYRREQWERPDP